MDVFSSVEMAGCDKQGATDFFCRRPARKMRSQKATKAVRNEDHVVVLTESGLKTRKPRIQLRAFPAVLRDQLRAWIVSQPMLLPMANS